MPLINFDDITPRKRPTQAGLINFNAIAGPDMRLTMPTHPTPPAKETTLPKTPPFSTGKTAPTMLDVRKADEMSDKKSGLHLSQWNPATTTSINPQQKTFSEQLRGLADKLSYDPDRFDGWVDTFNYNVGKTIWGANAPPPGDPGHNRWVDLLMNIGTIAVGVVGTIKAVRLVGSYIQEASKFIKTIQTAKSQPANKEVTTLSPVFKKTADVYRQFAWKGDAVDPKIVADALFDVDPTMNKATADAMAKYILDPSMGAVSDVAAKKTMEQATPVLIRMAEKLSPMEVTTIAKQAEAAVLSRYGAHSLPLSPASLPSPASKPTISLGGNVQSTPQVIAAGGKVAEPQVVTTPTISTDKYEVSHPLPERPNSTAKKHLSLKADADISAFIEKHAALTEKPEVAMDKTVPAINLQKSGSVDITDRVDLASVQVKYPTATTVVLDPKRRTVMFLHDTTPLEAIAIDKPQLKAWYGIDGEKILSEITQPVQPADQPVAPVTTTKQPWEMTLRDVLSRGVQWDVPESVDAAARDVAGKEVEKTDAYKRDHKKDLEYRKRGIMRGWGGFASDGPSDVTEMARVFNDVFTKEVHREAVRGALSEGKPVPPEVLADYPDLAQTAAQPTAEPLKSGGKLEISNGEQAIHTTPSPSPSPAPSPAVTATAQTVVPTVSLPKDLKFGGWQEKTGKVGYHGEEVPVSYRTSTKEVALTVYKPNGSSRPIPSDNIVYDEETGGRYTEAARAIEIKGVPYQTVLIQRQSYFHDGSKSGKPWYCIADANTGLAFGKTRESVPSAVAEAVRGVERAKNNGTDPGKVLADAAAKIGKRNTELTYATTSPSPTFSSVTQATPSPSPSPAPSPAVTPAVENAPQRIKSLITSGKELYGTKITVRGTKIGKHQEPDWTTVIHDSGNEGDLLFVAPLHKPDSYDSIRINTSDVISIDNLVSQDKVQPKRLSMETPATKRVPKEPAYDFHSASEWAAWGKRVGLDQRETYEQYAKAIVHAGGSNRLGVTMDMKDLNKAWSNSYPMMDDEFYKTVRVEPSPATVQNTASPQGLNTTSDYVMTVTPENAGTPDDPTFVDRWMKNRSGSTTIGTVLRSVNPIYWIDTYDPLRWIGDKSHFYNALYGADTMKDIRAFRGNPSVINTRIVPRFIKHGYLWGYGLTPDTQDRVKDVRINARHMYSQLADLMDETVKLNKDKFVQLLTEISGSNLAVPVGAPGISDLANRWIEFQVKAADDLITNGKLDPKIFSRFRGHYIPAPYDNMGQHLTSIEEMEHLRPGMGWVKEQKMTPAQIIGVASKDFEDYRDFFFQRMRSEVRAAEKGGVFNAVAADPKAAVMPEDKAPRNYIRIANDKALNAFDLAGKAVPGWVSLFLRNEFADASEVAQLRGWYRATSIIKWLKAGVNLPTIVRNYESQLTVQMMEGGVTPLDVENFFIRPLSALLGFDKAGKAELMRMGIIDSDLRRSLEGIVPTEEERASWRKGNRAGAIHATLSRLGKVAGRVRDDIGLAYGFADNWTKSAIYFANKEKMGPYGARNMAFITSGDYTSRPPMVNFLTRGLWNGRKHVAWLLFQDPFAFFKVVVGPSRAGNMLVNHPTLLLAELGLAYLAGREIIKRIAKRYDISEKEAEKLVTEMQNYKVLQGKFVIPISEGKVIDATPLIPMAEFFSQVGQEIGAHKEFWSELTKWGGFFLGSDAPSAFYDMIMSLRTNVDQNALRRYGKVYRVGDTTWEKTKWLFSQLAPGWINSVIRTLSDNEPLSWTDFIGDQIATATDDDKVRYYNGLRKSGQYTAAELNRIYGILFEGKPLIGK